MRLVPRITALNPVPLLLGPIFSKEMAVSGRRWSTYILRSTVCLVLLLITSLAFLQRNMMSFDISGWSAVQSTQIAVSLTYAIGMAQIFISAFVGVVSSSDAISSERTNRTIASLASTPLTNAQIVFGKFSSRLAELILLNLLPVPLLLLIRVFGGIEPELILVFTFSAICMGILGSGISIFISSWIARPFGVIFLVGFALFLFEMLPYFLLMVFSMGGNAQAERAAELLAYCSIPVAIVYTQFGAFFTGSTPGYTPLIVAGGLHIAAAIGLNILTAIILRAIIRSGATKDWAATNKKRRSRFRPKARPITPHPSKSTHQSTKKKQPRKSRKRSRQVSAHPVLWRESRQIMGGSLTSRIVGLSIFGVVMTLVYVIALVSDAMADFHYAITYLYSGILLFISIFAPAALVAGERDARTWDALLTTPLSIRSILWQKLIGTLLRPMVLIGAICLHFIIFAAPWMPRDARADVPILLAGLVLILLPWSVAFCGTGILCSTIMKGTRTAATGNFLVALFLWLFLPGLAFAILEIVVDYAERDQWVGTEFALVMISPLVLLAGLLNGATDGWPISDFIEYRDRDMKATEFFTLLASSALVAFGLAAASIELARLLVKRKTGRSN